MENEIIVNETDMETVTSKVPVKGLAIAGAALGLGFAGFLLVKKVIIPAIQKAKAMKEAEEYVEVE
jgi:hypothetical protein